jgi:hypothetical protein
MTDPFANVLTAEELAVWYDATHEKENAAMAELERPRQPVFMDCPDCGGTLGVRTSKMVASVRETRRTCVCGYADVATIRPAKIVEIYPDQLIAVRRCGTTTGPAQTQNIPIE